MVYYNERGKSLKGPKFLRKFILLSLMLILFSQVSLAATVKVANDPTRIGVGARILGMGKAYLGVSDDLAGMFINPAALASVDKWQATSMQGKFINEYNYFNLGSAIPTPFGSFGVGYVGSNISFTAPSATIETVDGVIVIPSTSEGSTYSFLNSVILFSWGKDIKGFSVGATVKVFALDLSGPGISQGKASGNEVDLGLNFKPNDVFKAGVVVQNALPFASGGKITWENGTEETFPSVLKLGASIKVLGETGLRQYDTHELSLNFDLDTTPLRPALPNLWHIGLEWKPMELLAVRTGVDQDYIGTGDGTSLTATNNFTAGVGLNMGRFRFDYAYHQYNSVSDNDTHYFSLSYGVTKEKPQEVKQPFKFSPKDKTIVFTPDVLVKGIILDKKIKQVSVKDEGADVAKDEFEVTVPLRLGKNSLLIEGFEDRDVVDTDLIRVLRLKKFKDVAADYWAAVPISILAMEKIVAGYRDGAFKPEGEITRAELCTLMIKALAIANAPAAKPAEDKTTESISALFPGAADLEMVLVSEERDVSFRDLKKGHWARKYIVQAVERGIVKGYPDNTFRPNSPVTRAEGVIMISKFAQLLESKRLEVPYNDVPGRHWAAKDIIKAKEAGILEYITVENFQPNKQLTRAEVAYMVAKTPLISPRVEAMLDWEKGY